MENPQWSQVFLYQSSQRKQTHSIVGLLFQLSVTPVSCRPLQSEKPSRGVTTACQCLSPWRVSLKIYSKLDVLRMCLPPPCFCSSSSWQNLSIKREIVNIFRLCPPYILYGTYTSASYQGTAAGYTHVNTVGAFQY